MVMADGPLLTAAHLGLEVVATHETASSSIDLDFVERPASDDFAAETAGALDDVPRAEPSLADRRVMQEAELILATLKTAPTKTLAAARLGISERTLRYKLARLRENGLMAAGV
jgi:transcriptional regulator with PAS, ATPase and Fis domain